MTRPRPLPTTAAVTVALDDLAAALAADPGYLRKLPPAPTAGAWAAYGAAMDLFRAAGVAALADRTPASEAAVLDALITVEVERAALSFEAAAKRQARIDALRAAGHPAFGADR